MKNDDDRIIEKLVQVCNELADEGYNGTNAHIKQGDNILRMKLDFGLKNMMVQIGMKARMKQMNKLKYTIVCIIIMIAYIITFALCAAGSWIGIIFAIALTLFVKVGEIIK